MTLCIERDSAIFRAQSAVESGRFQADLAKLVGFRTESQHMAQAGEPDECLTKAMSPRLTAMRFDCTNHENPKPGGAPLLAGRGGADNKAQNLINMTTTTATITARGNLGYNTKSLIEMPEETGSVGRYWHIRSGIAPMPHV